MRIPAHAVGVVVAVLVWLIGPSQPAAGQNNEEGLAVSVPNPLTSEGFERIKNQVTTRRNNEARPLRKVIFDFNPDAKPALTTSFGPCSDLAGFISGLREVQTIAFVHNRVTGHTVLPVLACKELVMSKGEAGVGEIAAETVPSLSRSQQEAYREIFNRPPLFAIVRKMYDRDVRLAKGTKIDGQNSIVWYVDGRDEQENKRQRIVGIEDVRFSPPGQLGFFTTEQAREIGLCQATADSRSEVAEKYGISPASIRDDPLQGRSPEAYHLTLKGDVNGAMRESLQRVLKDTKRRKGNILFLTLACGGGDAEAARAIADDLRQTQTGDEALRVVGFIPDQAPDTATFIAFGCSDIVMSRRRDLADPNRPEDAREAEMGDFEAFIGKGPRAAATADAYRKSLKELAEAQGYPGILVDGMFDRNLEIIWASGTVDRSQRRLMTRAEFEAEPGKWQAGPTIKPKGQLLKLTATRAGELGVARYVTETRDPAQVYSLYGLEPGKVREATPGWLDRFADFLQMPAVTVLLVVIGFTGLILELKVPGLTVPGIIAALCFILVFWAQSRFSGETFILALLLFILGLVLVALEIFVLPGFGAPGIFGVFCMLAGLGLVTFEKIPQTTDEWGGLGVKVSEYLFGMMGSFALAFFIARFLPKMPYANRLVLGLPSDSGTGELVLPGAGEAAGLAGAVGTTTTPLRPAGVVRFGEKYVDVVSDGGFIPAGTRVAVIAVENTRIVVKEV